MSRVRVATLAGVALVLVAAGAVGAATLTRSGGAVTKIYAATSMDTATTTSLTPANVAGMSLTVHVPSTQKALLVITFSSESTCAGPVSASTYCLVAAYVDGNQADPQQGVYFDDGANPNAEARSMQWIYGPVASGDHVVQMKFNTGINTTFTLGNKTLTVLRSKV